MKTIQIELPQDLENQLDMIEENPKDFIVKAIREKMSKKEILKDQLIEGYKKTYNEDLEIAKDFESPDLENWK